MENFQDVVTANRALLARARDLNTRAGTSMFPVQGSDELMKLFTVALGGARRVAEIPNLPALLLPALDEKMVEKVLREQPDTITILGHEVTVEYRGGGYNPRVRLDFRGDESQDWLSLPDDGIHLPCGREVSMYSSVEGYGYYIEANSSQFKAKARECLNSGQWDKWEKPNLPAPTESIPPVVEAEYGRCVVTDTSLLAYGTVKYDSYYKLWESYWTRDRAEADKAHAEACVEFVEAHEKVARDVLKKRVGELQSAHYYNSELPQVMRTCLYSTHYGYSGGATTVAEIKALIAEVEAAVEAGAARKAEAEQKIREVGARRQEVNTALNEIGYPEAHIWVPESGEVAYVLAGKTSKMGNFVVFPTAGDTSYKGPYCFGNSKYRAWVPFQLGVRSKAQDFSGGGNLQSEVELFVPKGLLLSGVYGVGADDEGQFFFPVIHHNVGGEEVVPEIAAIRKIRVLRGVKIAPKGSGASASTDRLAALAAKFKK